MNETIQTRAHCPFCGSIQAVNARGIAKHGYKVQYGFFNGVCAGSHRLAMETSRDYTESLFVMWAEHSQNLKARHEQLKAGTVTPLFVRRGHGMRARQVAWADGTPREQREARESAIWQTLRESEFYADHVVRMRALLDRVHGQEFIKEVRKAAAERIEAGEKRIGANGKVLTAMYQEGARVHWFYLNDDGKKVKSWTGSKAWRGLDLAA